MFKSKTKKTKSQNHAVFQLSYCGCCNSVKCAGEQKSKKGFIGEINRLDKRFIAANKAAFLNQIAEVLIQMENENRDYVLMEIKMHDLVEE